MKLVLNVILILVITVTLCVCIIKPDMHKNVIVYDSDYTLVTEDEVKTEIKEIPVMEVPAKPAEKTIVVEKKSEPKTTNLTKQTTNVKQQIVKKTAPVTVQQQTVAKPQTQTVTKPVTTTLQKPVEKEVIKVETPKIEQKVIEKPVEQPKVMTQQEETIAWNKWRSALTNKIMQDTRLPDIPTGVLFQFSFTVDKYGKISNVQTGANPANYTPYAIQYIAPVIRSYQGRSILNFPEGTARTSTQVTGKWRISNTEKYSTPQDYNDYEKVIR